MTIKMRISRARCKERGRYLQKEVAKKISEITGISYGKDEPIASREMGQSGPDVRLVGEAKRIFPFAIEAKYQEKWNVVEWIKQAKKNMQDSGKYLSWLLVLKKNNLDPVIVLDMNVFFSIALPWIEKMKGNHK